MAAGDTALAVTLVVLSFVPGAAHQGVDLAELPDRPLDASGLLLLLAQSLPLVVRRRWPAVCLTVVCGAFAAFQLLRYPTASASIGLPVALYSAGAHLRGGRIAAPVVAMAAYVAFAVALHAVGSPERFMDYVTFALVLVVCWAAGAWVRARDASVAEQQRRAEDAVVAAERARIARELHDVVTHHVTAMVVQADAAQFLKPDRVTSSLSAISETGRRALTDLRYLLGALDGTGNSVLEPATGELSELVARSRAAGQPVELVEQGRPRLMASATEVAAYRVVQEALTNALKHAAGERTVVRVNHGDEWMDLEVTTDGPSGPGLGRGSGRGLVGLRERVSVVGGDLRAGTGSDGGFTVWARIPVGMS
ncbi:histidine kinase [Pseudonocardia sp.]|uniref:sensor histidine kinase n=1 Tax=Pseudonocardia sp. TaxID=60912 RepID=UPI0031FD7586